MQKVIYYEIAIAVLNEQYDMVKKLIVAGHGDLALSVYQTCANYLDFMYRLGLVDYSEYLELMGEHHNIFDELFEF